jgi:cytochrome c553
MTTQQIAERIIALRDVTRTTGTITKRAQNELLSRLPDEQLAEVAVWIRTLEANERNENDRNNPRE